MNIIKKSLLIFVTLSLIFACCSCGNSNEQTTENLQVDDIVEYIAGIPKDTVFLTVDGHEVTAEEYLYWTSQAIDSMYQYGSSTYDIDTDDSEYNWIDTYWENGIKPTILQCIENYCMSMIHASDYGLEVSQEKIDEKLSEAMENSKAYYESEDQFIEALMQLCMTETGYEKLMEESIWYSLLYEYLYSEGTDLYPTDDQVIEFADKNGYYNCKYIYLSTGTKYDDEGINEVRERAEEVKDIVLSYSTSEEIEEAFDSFLTNYNWNEDTEESEDGLLSGGGWLDDTFDEGVRNMSVGEISIIEDEDYGFFVVLKLAIEPDSLRETCAASLFNEQLAQWDEDADVEYTDAYKNFDPRNFYINLTDYRMQTDSESSEN